MTDTRLTSTARRIGPAGTVGRLIVGLALLVLAFADKPAGLIWGLELYELVLGLVVFPAVMVAIGLLARRYADGPLRFTGPGGVAANFVVIIVLFAIPYTAVRRRCSMASPCWWPPGVGNQIAKPRSCRTWS